MLVAQLDYIFFFFGLVLFLLGAVCVSMSRTGPVPTPWWLLGAFAFAHGAAEWLYLLALTAGDPPWLRVVRTLVVATSFLFLIEFARRAHRALLGSAPSAWLHLPLVSAVTCIGLAFGWSSLDPAVRLLLGTPAALWTSFLFLTAASRSDELGGSAASGRARLWGGVYFTAFGLTAGLIVPPAPFLPQIWPSAESVLRWTGIPIQLVRAATVCGIAFSVWALAVSFDPKGRVLRKKRLLFWVMAGSVVVLLAAGWIFTDRLGQLHERDLVEEAESAAAQAHDHLMMEIRSADREAHALAGILERFHVVGGAVDPARLDGVVDAIAAASDDSVVYVLDPGGNTIAASNRDRPDSFLGKSFAMRSYFQTALEGRPGHFFGVGLVSGVPGYYSSEPVHDGSGRVAAVAVVKRNLTSEQLGPAGGTDSFIVSADGRVLVSRDRDPLQPIRSDLATMAHGSTELLTLGSARYIAVRRPVAPSDWSLVVLRKERTRVANRILGIVITLLLCSVVLTYFVAMQRQYGTETHITIRRQEAEGRARELARQADTDALTGLLNRLGFNGAIAREVSRARRHRQPLSVVMMDLDHFKRVNDEHGHPAGDAVLQRTAALVTGSVRESDLVARWGGEEFVVVAPMTNASGAARLAEKLRALMASTPIGPSGPVTGSFGVAELRADEPIEALLQRADDALYRAKHGGRNTVVNADLVPMEVPGPSGPQEDADMTKRDLYSETGYGPIDQEHRSLSEALEAFVMAVNTGKASQVGTALEGIVAGVGRHFSHEEALMRQFRYAQLKQHAEAHALFVRDVQRFQAELRQGGVTAGFRRWAVERLPEWFRFHILAYDVALGQFLGKAGADAGPGATVDSGPRIGTEIDVVEA